MAYSPPTPAPTMITSSFVACVFSSCMSISFLWRLLGPTILRAEQTEHLLDQRPAAVAVDHHYGALAGLGETNKTAVESGIVPIMCEGECAACPTYDQTETVFARALLRQELTRQSRREDGAALTLPGLADRDH